MKLLHWMHLVPSGTLEDTTDVSAKAEWGSSQWTPQIIGKKRLETLLAGPEPTWCICEAGCIKWKSKKHLKYVIGSPYPDIGMWTSLFQDPY